MNKIGLVIGGLVAIMAVFGAVYFISYREAHAPSEDAMNGTGNPAVGANGESMVITYTDDGFSPSSLTVSPGTTITWSNQSSHKLWVLDATLSSTACPVETTSGVLDECASIGNGGSYSFTAGSDRTIQYTNKNITSHTGTIVITSEKPVINPDAIPQ